MYTARQLVHVNFLGCASLAGKRADVICGTLQKIWDEVFWRVFYGLIILHTYIYIYIYIYIKGHLAL